VGPERWKRIRSIFQAVLGTPEPLRARYLDEACGDDESLRADIDSLLAANAQPGGKLDRLPELETAPAAAEPEDDARIGERVGAYALVRHLGAGGMGTVYAARRVDGAFAHEVAIKLVKRGMDTDAILARFFAERQILAALAHPGICRLLDGGATSDGLPYFVMEYIDGEPVDLYCRRAALSVPRRLELFLAVCDAVQHAHRNLVVHRDIKPRNILVGADGAPKLVDFGIAKFLGAGTEATGAGAQLMTLAYASPEQVRGEAVTPATDVHALGILLYELLVEERPFSGSPLQLAHAVLETEPRLLSRAAPSRRLARALRGDLENIVAMALRKDPARRYASAGELAADVGRHLRGEAVLARRDALAYRAGKLIRRHRLAFGAAVAVVLSLVAGIATTTWQARRAEHERARAERRLADARRMANALVFEIHDAIEDLAGAMPARRLLVERGLANLDALAAEKSDDPTLQRALAEGYLRLGTVQGRPGQPNLGERGAARASYEKGLRIVNALIARVPDDAGARVLHARYVRSIGLLDEASGDWDSALALDHQAIAELDALGGAIAGDVEARYLSAALRSDIGDVLLAQSRFAEALPVFREALAGFEALVASGATELRCRRAVPIALVKVGEALLATGERAGALAVFREALAQREVIIAEAPESGPAKQELSMSHVRIGDVLFDGRDAAGALAAYRRGLELAREAFAAAPTDVKARGNVAYMLHKLGQAQLALDEPIEAAASFREGLAIYKELKERGQFLASDESIYVALEKQVGGGR